MLAPLNSGCMALELAAVDIQLLIPSHHAHDTHSFLNPPYTLLNATFLRPNSCNQPSHSL